MSGSGTVVEGTMEPVDETFRHDVRRGLLASPKSIPSKYLYDERGSQLFEQICETPEYYLTRTELQLTRRYAQEMARSVGPRALLIEPGSGSSVKTRILLAAMEQPAGYVPVDISREHLAASAAELDAEFPGLTVLPVHGDFMKPLKIPQPASVVRRRVAYFPGSTIGNLTHDQARHCLGLIRTQVGPGGGLLIGVDLDKDPRILEAAYNDAAGVTASFTMNLLVRINRELGADFDLDRFEHRAVYNPNHRRIEMGLVSLADQHVRLNGAVISFQKGETIRTEYSHKYTVDGFARLGAEAGWRVERVWTDERQWFSVQYLVADDPAADVGRSK